MAYSLNSSTTILGYIQRESVRKSANLDIFAMPGGNSGSAQAWDFNGAQREITIDGRLEATSVANLKTAIKELDDLITGSQAAINYVSDRIDGTVKVRVDSFDWSGSPTDTGELTASYILRLVETADI